MTGRTGRTNDAATTDDGLTALFGRSQWNVVEDNPEIYI